MSDRIVAVAIAIAVAAITAMLWIAGAEYYLTPLSERPLSPLHGELAPSQPTGHLLGWLGLLAMLLLLLYTLRKRARWLRRAGSLRHWLSGHIFLGLLGPVLITFHSAFQVGGLVSIAYWSMVVTMVSGIFGRYVYVQIPSSLLGDQRSPAALSAAVRQIEDELDARLKDQRALVPAAPLSEDTPDSGGGAIVALIADDLRRPWRRWQLGRRLRGGGLSRGDARDVARLAHRRDLMLRRVALAASLSEVFRYWHALHKPFVYIMFLIAAVHVGVAFLLGYSGLPW